jgi:hypothetical protein
LEYYCQSFDYHFQVGLVLQFRLVALRLSQEDLLVFMQVPLAVMDQIGHSHQECLSQDLLVSLLGLMAVMDQIGHFHLECSIQEDLLVSM